MEEKNSNKFTKVQVFRKISNIFEENGFKVTAQQCESKMKLLEQTYKNQLAQRKKTGEGRREWEYFDAMHDLLFKKPHITPVSIGSNLKGFREPKPQKNETKVSKINLDEESTSSSEEEDKGKQKEKKRQTKESTGEKTLKLIKKKHKIDVAFKDRMCSFMEDYMKILKDKNNN